MGHKNNVQSKLLSGNASDAWNGLNRITSKTCKEPLVSNNLIKFANYLNRFYARLNNIDYRD